MNLVFQEQGELVKQMQEGLASLNQRSISLILNQELFYHARQQLPNHIPNEHTPPSDHQLASKLLKQISQSSDLDLTVQQIHHRVDIMLNDKHNQLEELKQKFEAQRQKMRTSGAKVQQFRELYDQEIKNCVSINTPLSKKMIGYFETSTKDWNLEEVVSDLLNGLQSSCVERDESQPSEPADQQTRQQLQRFMDQLKLAQNIFNFEL